MPQNIKLLRPFNNRKYLRAILARVLSSRGATHNADPATLPAIKANAFLCISSGCHDADRNVGRWADKVKFWDAIGPVRPGDSMGRRLRISGVAL